jgi:hypothetical protein
MVTNLPSSYFRTYLKSYLMVSVYIAEIISRGESTLSCYPYLCNLFYSLIWSLRALNLTFIFELNNSHNLFFSSILKYNTILDIYIFPPDTSYICLTIFKHIYSISADSIGDDIESVYNNKGTKNEKKNQTLSNILVLRMLPNDHLMVILYFLYRLYLFFLKVSKIAVTKILLSLNYDYFWVR